MTEEFKYCYLWKKKAENIDRITLLNIKSATIFTMQVKSVRIVMTPWSAKMSLFSHERDMMPS